MRKDLRTSRPSESLTSKSEKSATANNQEPHDEEQQKLTQNERRQKQPLANAMILRELIRLYIIFEEKAGNPPIMLMPCR
jgi:hypothetical protein